MRTWRIPSDLSKPIIALVFLRYSFYALYLSSASIPISLFSDFAQGQANADNGQYNTDQAEEDCNIFHSLQSG